MRRKKVVKCKKVLCFLLIAAMFLVIAMPAAYYFIKLKYDGQDIYDLRRPHGKYYEDYYSLPSIPSAPTVQTYYYNSDENLYGVRILVK